MKERPWYVPAVDMRAVVVLLIMSAFGWAFYKNPLDETLKGALIAAFSGAWGFYLGSNKSSAEVREQATRATTEAIAFARDTVASMPTPEQSVPPKVQIEQPAGKPVPIEEKPGTERYAWETQK